MEALICAAEMQTLRKNPIDNKVDRTSENDKGKICGQNRETVCYITSQCTSLSQKEYK